MSKLITNNLKLFNVDNFIESFTERNYNIYYYFLAYPRPYASDSSPPTLYDNPQTTEIDVYDNMICGRRITSEDVAQMTSRKDWVSDVVYTPYSHDSTNLFTSNFYVVQPESGSYHVFKCIDNNNGSKSTVAPLFSQTAADDDFYFTADGYQWKYMYSITSTQYSKFATADFIPVYVNANVVGNAVSGAIQSIQLTKAGAGYSSYSNGYFQEVRVGGNPLIYAIDSTTASSNANFYINSAIKITSGPGSGQQKFITGYTVSGSTRRVIIDSAFSTAPTTLSKYDISPLVQVIGDGSGALARATVNASSNSIQGIEITSRGQGYTYASVVITGNTGVINVTTGSTTTNTAVAKVIISPAGGHGSNAAAELGSRNVGISAEFNSTLSGGKVVDENDFRVVGIIKDPLFANVILAVSNGTGTFSDGEVVYQSQGSPIAGIVVTNPGSGYSSNATITISGTSSVAAIANASSNSTGRISQINISNTGQGYIAPDITISAPAPVTFNANTGVSSGDDFISIATNVFQNNDVVKYLVATGNTAVSGLANNTSYYVVGANSSGVKLSSTLNGGAINLTASATSETGHSLTGVAVSSASKTFNANTQVSNADDFISISGNAFENNSIVNYLVAAGNTAVSGLANNTSYYVVQANSTGVKLSSTLGGGAINLTASSTSETGHTLSGNVYAVATATAVAVVDTNKTTTAYGVVTFANSSVVRLSNSFGIFVTGNSSTSVLTGNTSGYIATCDSVTQPTTYFDQTYKVIGTMEASEFIEDELITQRTNANGYFYSQSGTGANPRTVRLVNKRGTINQSDISVAYTIDGATSGGRLNVSALVEPDLVHGSGDVIYIENFSPVEKTAGQIETIKLILKF